MAVRGTMASLITSVRVLINDTLPAGSGQIFDDQTIQDVMDESRIDVVNGPMDGRPTFTGATVQYLNYYTDLGGWEDGMVIKQYLTVAVTPSLIEPIAGHFQFAANTYPPLYITGTVHDRYHAAADLLQRWAAKWVLLYSVSVDGQSLQRAQAHKALTDLAKFYRLQQRAGSISMSRSDGNSGARTGNGGPSLAPTALDYLAKG